MKFSRALALVGGVFLPIAETARRWHQLGDIHMAPAWVDDWLIGLFLLYGFWRTRRNDRSGRAVLATAWGFACGLAYASFFGQLASLNQADPSGIASTKVVAFKGAMFLAAIAALIATLASEPALELPDRRDAIRRDGDAPPKGTSS